MTKQNLLFQQVIEQHYFHCLIYKSGNPIQISELWKKIGNTIIPENSIKEFHNIEIQHRKLKHPYGYARGNMLNLISENGDGLPPYYYDIYIMNIKTKNADYIVFAFPFFKLAKEIIARIIVKANLFKDGVFIKTNINKLLSISKIELEREPLIANFVGLQCSRLGLDIHYINISGDFPLESDLYKDFLQKAIENNSFRPEQAAIACKIKFDDNPILNILINRTIRSRIHFDCFGNYTFYVHLHGKNFNIWPYFIEKLVLLNCIEEVNINPLEKISEQ